MEQLIKLKAIPFGDNQKIAVDARELHWFLGSKREFATWIKERIKTYQFAENEDFCSFNKIVKRETGGVIIKEYALTINCAKELCMVENNEKGRQARRYFIEIEERYRAGQMVPIDFTKITKGMLGKFFALSFLSFVPSLQNQFFPGKRYEKKYHCTRGESRLELKCGSRWV